MSSTSSLFRKVLMMRKVPSLVHLKSHITFVLIVAIGAMALLATVETAQAVPGQPDRPTLFVDYDEDVVDNYIGAYAELTATTNSVSGAARYEWDLLRGTVSTTRPSVTRGVFVSDSIATASVKVRAVDSEGNAGQWSSTASTSTALTNIYFAPRPPMPTLSFDEEDKTITISVYGYRGATEYTIKITAPGGSKTRKTVTDTVYAYSVPLSDPSGTWKVSVQATTATHRTAFSRTALLAVKVPEQPVELSAEAGNGQVTLTWKDPGDSGIAKYQLQVDHGEWTDIEGSDAGTTSHTVTGLTNGTRYLFQIRAVSNSGAGEASDRVLATPVALPKPTGLAATSDDGQVTLTWKDPGDSGITKYQLRVDYGEWTDIEGSDAGTTSHTVTGLTNGTRYLFQIRAVSNSGAGEASDRVLATPVALPKPTGLAATSDDGQVTLTWKDPGDSGITKYQLRVDYGEWTDIEGSDAGTTSHTVTGLTNGTRYLFQIRAVSNSGVGEKSDTVLAYPEPVPELAASVPSSLTEATLHGSVVTLRLTGRSYLNAVRNNVTVSGIEGVTFRSSTDVDRVSDTEVTVKLTFNGNIDSDTMLVFTVGASAIAGYTGPALTAEIPVTAVAESVVASAPQPLTEATLHGSVVTLTLSGGAYERWNTVRNNVTVSGIEGVTFRSSTDVDRVSDTEVTVKLTFNGNIDSDTMLVFTVGASAIAGYTGPAFTAEIPVSADEEAAPDFDGDGRVDFFDFIRFTAVFGSSQGDARYDARYDLDGDGTIGFGDFLIFANSFGK